MEGIMKTVVIYKTLLRDVRDSKIEEFKNKFPQFQIYSDFKQTKYSNIYQIKARGTDEAIKEYQEKEEQEKEMPFVVIINILKKELEPLREMYIKKTLDWANEDYNKCLVISKMSQEELINKYGKEVEIKNYYTGSSEKKIILDVNTRSYVEYCKGVVKEDINRYIKKSVKLAEDHYHSSLVKLAERIHRKNLNIENMKVKTKYSDINANISTVLSDGKKSVTAWTIIASGEIQRPHYRYLVK
jgi:hypothetical protein